MDVLLRLFIYFGLVPLLRFVFQAVATAFRFSFRAFCQYGIAAFLTPAGHVKFGDFQKTEGYVLLDQDGYGVQPWWASNSVSKIKKA